jgi:hypothetical protein
MHGRWCVLLLLVFSCSGASVRQTAEGYLGALAKLDFDGAASYVAEDRRADFRDLRQLYATLPPAEQQKFKLTDWKVESETITGTTAVVDFSFDGDRKGELALTRIGGAWKVDHRSY